MASMLKGLFGTKAPAVQLPPPLHLRYQLYRNRWHLDSREPLSFVVLHDVYACGAALSPVASGITRIPVRGASPIIPLDVYVPDLRSHGLSASDADASIMAHVSDVLDFVRAAVEFKEAVHLVGFGHGARVALAAGLVAPTQITTITAIDPALDKERTVSIRNVLKTLPPAQSANLVSMNEALSRVMPSERDRLGYLLNFAEGNGVNPPAWKSSPWLSTLSTDEAVASLHSWPAALHGKVYAGKTRLIKYQQATSPSQLPDGLARTQLPHATEVTFADTLPADQVFESLLAQLELIDDVSHVVEAATSC